MAVIRREIGNKVLKTSVSGLVELNILKNLTVYVVAGSLGRFKSHASNIVFDEHSENILPSSEGDVGLAASSGPSVLGDKVDEECAAADPSEISDAQNNRKRCPLQVWALSSTPTSKTIFPVSSVYANMDYLLRRKDNIVHPDSDRDPYPWIIWYIWKARNDKLFRGIDRDPLKLVRYAENECQAWFDANEMVPSPQQEHSSDQPQVLSLGSICMIDGTLTSTSQFSGCGWAWMDSLGEVQLMGTRNYIRRESHLHSELEALIWAIESMLQYSTCQSFGTDCKDLIAMIKEPQAWPCFAI
ncbi:hypothetical protein F2Q68_00035655 [Brassica cretica]|uniref:RNase H type-1 domain-containing protein n=1 Tax=Brassica cretica TaxID=69181 RepID=A0A8S9H5Y8_BRACR|nr:hypothetical protein F2Q68_00035655 [Brassica cretica]